MKRPHNFSKITCYIMLLSVSLTAGGCGLADMEAIFTDPKELDAQAMEDPSFWNASILADGYQNLYELDNDLFINKPYNNLHRFGDDILLVGEAYYGESLPDDPDASIKYEYSFDVYSPWRNHVLYSLRHQDISCDRYQVVGDKLFLFNYSTNTIEIYNTSLKREGSYTLSDIPVNEHLSFYTTNLPDSYYAVSDDSSKLLQFTFAGNSMNIEKKNLGHYNYLLGDSSSTGSTFALSGVNTSTLCYDYTIVDNTQPSSTYNILADNIFLGDVSDESFVGLTNSTESYWVYSDLNGNDTYFRCFDVQQVYALPDGSFILVQRAYDDSQTDYHVTFSRYTSAGKLLSSFTYDCGSIEDDNFLYISQDMSYFEDQEICFILAYTLDLEPYLLVWDTTQGRASADDLVMYATEEELAMRTDSIYYAQYAEQIETEYGSQATYIYPWEDYDWGKLTEVNNRATAIEEKYNISIYLGPEVPDLIDTFSVSLITNVSKINTALDELESALACYPDNFLSQLAVGNNRGIRIYLGGSIKSTTAEALSEPSGFVNEINDYMIMVLDIDYSWNWDQTIAHELSHMIDRRLEFLNIATEDALFSEEEWSTYNPDQCSYLESYNGYENNDQYELYSDYFIDAYSLTFPTEDRAVLFGTAMSDYLDSTTYDDYFDLQTPTGRKFYYYCKCIRNGFDTTGWDKPTSWEQIISY